MAYLLDANVANQVRCVSPFGMLRAEGARFVLVPGTPVIPISSVLWAERNSADKSLEPWK